MYLIFRNSGIEKDALQGSLCQMLFENFAEILFGYLKIREYYIVLVKILSLSAPRLFSLPLL